MLLLSTAAQQSNGCHARDSDPSIVNRTPAILQDASWELVRLCDTSTCLVVPLFFFLLQQVFWPWLCLASHVMCPRPLPTCSLHAR
jgi:hypothetical protein